MAELACTLLPRLHEKTPAMPTARQVHMALCDGPPDKVVQGLMATRIFSRLLA